MQHSGSGAALGRARDAGRGLPAPTPSHAFAYNNTHSSSPGPRGQAKGPLYLLTAAGWRTQAWPPILASPTKKKQKRVGQRALGDKGKPAERSEQRAPPRLPWVAVGRPQAFGLC